MFSHTPKNFVLLVGFLSLSSLPTHAAQDQCKDSRLEKKLEPFSLKKVEAKCAKSESVEDKVTITTLEDKKLTLSCCAAVRYKEYEAARIQRGLRQSHCTQLSVSTNQNYCTTQTCIAAQANLLAAARRSHEILAEQQERAQEIGKECEGKMKETAAKAEVEPAVIKKQHSLASPADKLAIENSTSMGGN